MLAVALRGKLGANVSLMFAMAAGVRGKFNMTLELTLDVAARGKPKLAELPRVNESVAFSSPALTTDEETELLTLAVAPRRNLGKNVVLMLAVAPRGNVGNTEELIEAVAPRGKVGAKTSLIFKVAPRRKLGAKTSLMLAVAPAGKVALNCTTLPEFTAAATEEPRSLNRTSLILAVAPRGNLGEKVSLTLAVAALLRLKMPCTALPEFIVAAGEEPSEVSVALVMLAVAAMNSGKLTTMESLMFAVAPRGNLGVNASVTEAVAPLVRLNPLWNPLLTLAVAARGKPISNVWLIEAVADRGKPRLATGADEMLVIKLGMLLTPVNWSMVVPPVIVVLIR
jgi:hypothetical protein